jgi:hypothetical protein
MDPAEISARLVVLEEKKQQEEALTLLNQVSAAWNDNLIEDLETRTPLRTLRHICRAAMVFGQEDLYTRMARARIAPIDDESDDRRVWEEFMATVMDSNSSKILVASLRFFQEDFESLWYEHGSFLKTHAELCFADPNGLGSITRILYNSSIDNNSQRSESLVELLKLVWEAAAEADEGDDVPSTFNHGRTKLFLKALRNAGDIDATLFADAGVWGVQTVRNLIRVSIVGRREVGPAASVVDEYLTALKMSPESQRAFKAELDQIEGK